jgi:hypothetical protein
VNPSNNFVGVTNGPTTQPDHLQWITTSTAIPDLRAGTRHVVVTFAGGTLTVSVDGAEVLETAATLPPQVLVGFSGATGGITDRHAVSNVSIALQ